MPDGTQNVSWFEPLSPEDKGYLQLKGWDKLPDPVAAATAILGSYREAEKKIGAPPESMIRWPGENDADGMKNVYKRLGVPEAADKYDFSAVKRADGSAVDATLLDTIRTTAFSANMTPAQANAIAAGLVKSADDRAQAAKAEATISGQAEDVKLRAAWAGNYDVFKAVNARFLEQAGFTPAQASVFMATAQGQQMLYAVAAMDAEAKGHGVGGGAGGGNQNLPMSPEAAGQALELKKADPVWANAWMGSPGVSPEAHKAAKDEFANLTRIMVGAPPQR